MERRRLGGVVLTLGLLPVATGCGDSSGSDPGPAPGQVTRNEDLPAGSGENENERDENEPGENEPDEREPDEKESDDGTGENEPDENEPGDQ